MQQNQNSSSSSPFRICQSWLDYHLTNLYFFLSLPWTLQRYTITSTVKEYFLLWDRHA